MSQVIICAIYKSPKREGMYLYIEKKSGLESLPQSLLNTFGEPRFVMTLALSPGRKLARVDRALVEQAIKTQGYYLQMPPAITDFLKKNSVSSEKQE